MVPIGERPWLRRSFRTLSFTTRTWRGGPTKATLNAGSASRRSKAAISFPEQIRSEPWLETPILETLRQGVSSPRCFGVARPLRGDSTGGTLPGLWSASRRRSANPRVSARSNRSWCRHCRYRMTRAGERAARARCARHRNTAAVRRSPINDAQRGAGCLARGQAVPGCDRWRRYDRCPPAGSMQARHTTQHALEIVPLTPRSEAITNANACVFVALMRFRNVGESLRRKLFRARADESTIPPHRWSVPRR